MKRLQSIQQKRLKAFWWATGLGLALGGGFEVSKSKVDQTLMSPTHSASVVMLTVPFEIPLWYSKLKG